MDLNQDGVEDWSTDVLQTDAAINAGNSGGALINIAGELVGINSMKIAESSVEGLGFAIPINSAIPVIEELEKSGQVQRPTMGVSLVDLSEVPSYYQQQTLQIPDEVTSGVVISQVVRGSAAEKAGLKQYDVIVEMDGKKIENAIDLRKHLYNETEIGDTLQMKVYRQGQLVEVQLKLVQNAELVGIELDELAEKKLLSAPLQAIVESDEGLFGVDETLALGSVFTYGSIAVTTFGHLDKQKIGIIEKLDTKAGHVNTFLDDLVGSIAACAASRLAHRMRDLEEEGETFADIPPVDLGPTNEEI